MNTFALACFAVGILGSAYFIGSALDFSRRRDLAARDVHLIAALPFVLMSIPSFVFLLR